MVDEPKSNDKTSKPKQEQPELSSLANNAALGGLPASTSKTPTTNGTKKREYAKYIMWPVVTIWRGIKAVIVFLDKYGGAITALATIAIGVLTYFYVGYSQKQWQVAQDTLTISNRAYVTIGTKEGVVARFVPSKDKTQKAELVMYFQNSGRLPADLAWGIIPGLAFVARPTGTPEHPSGITYDQQQRYFRLPIRMRNKKTGAVSVQGQPGQQIGKVAGDSIFVAPIGEISMEDFVKLPSQQLSTIVAGGYQYCDQLGTEVTRSFLLSYQNAPSAELNFRLVYDGPMFAPPRPASTIDSEYLSPCETIAEKRQNQQKNTEQENAKKPWWRRWLRF